MRRELKVVHETLPLKAPFRIARGTKLAAEVVTVQLTQAGAVGRGESVPYKRYGESVPSVLAQIEALRAPLCEGMRRDELQARLPAGAARNAVDDALWDLESRLTGTPVHAALGHVRCPPVVSALTVGIDTPERMQQAASRLRGSGLIKVKLDANDPAACITAVREAVPDARLIVDANEAWDIALLRDMQPALERGRVELIEQPLPAAQDDALLDFTGRIPVCADEACHTVSDLPRLRGRYQAINIKLDKTGGLTEAWRLLQAAAADGFQIMVGCMVGSSLGIAPAMELAREAAFIDLDGPLWLQHDHVDGIQLRNGCIHPPTPGFWGG